MLFCPFGILFSGSDPDSMFPVKYLGKKIISISFFGRRA